MLDIQQVLGRGRVSQQKLALDWFHLNWLKVHVLSRPSMSSIVSGSTGCDCAYLPRAMCSFFCWAAVENHCMGEIYVPIAPTIFYRNLTRSALFVHWCWVTQAFISTPWTWLGLYSKLAQNRQKLRSYGADTKQRKERGTKETQKEQQAKIIQFRSLLLLNRFSRTHH